MLVFVFLRGGLDALTTCVPYGDGDLYGLRPNLAIRPPGASGGALDLDGFFGLAPAAAPLLPAFQLGHLALVHAAGSPDPTRSHFDAMRFHEAATPLMPQADTRTGWLGRALAVTRPQTVDAPRGLAFGPHVTRTLIGGERVLPVNNVESFANYGHAASAVRRRASLVRMHRTAPEPIRATGLATVAALDLLSSVDFSGYQPEHGADYPGSSFGGRMRNAATLVKEDLGIEVLQVDYEGWDDHASMGPTSGALASRLDDLCKSLAAFHADLTNELDRMTLVIASEFGRRAYENGSGGTDHGHGGLMMLLGGNVNGGRVVTDWPGLGPADLDDGSLAVTTDYRDVLGEVLHDRMGVGSFDSVFPGHVPQFLDLTR